MFPPTSRRDLLCRLTPSQTGPEVTKSCQVDTQDELPQGERKLLYKMKNGRLRVAEAPGGWVGLPTPEGVQLDSPILGAAAWVEAW